MIHGLIEVRQGISSGLAFPMGSKFIFICSNANNITFYTILLHLLVVSNRRESVC